MIKTYKVYKITNKINGKMYVGVTTLPTIEKRFDEHAGNVSRTRHLMLHRAITKYGKENFKIELISEAENEKRMYELEKFYILKFRSYFKTGEGYNMTLGGKGGHNDQTPKPKLVRLPRTPISAETRAKLSAASKGRIKSVETRMKLSKAHTGKVLSQETKDKLSKINTGKKLSQEQKHQRKLQLAELTKKRHKTFTIQSPSGEILTYTCLVEFCRQHHLTPSNIHKVLNGERNHHKGWKLP